MEARKLTEDEFREIAAADRQRLSYAQAVQIAAMHTVLRQWCIEQAIACGTDEVIESAEKILKFVTEPIEQIKHGS